MKDAPPSKTSSQAPSVSNRLTDPPKDAPLDPDPADGPQGEQPRDREASAPDTPAPPRAPSSGHGIDDDRLRAILRGSAAKRPPPDLLGGIQRRIFERSRGKFYGDGWSRSKATTSSYIVTSILVLGIFLLAYYVLLPSLPVK